MCSTVLISGGSASVLLAGSRQYSFVGDDPGYSNNRLGYSRLIQKNELGHNDYMLSYQYSLTPRQRLIWVVCHGNFGPRKFRSGGPKLPVKLVRPDQIFLEKLVRLWKLWSGYRTIFSGQSVISNSCC